MPKKEKSYAEQVQGFIKGAFRTPGSTMAEASGKTSARTKRRVKQFREGLGLKNKKKKSRRRK